MVEDRRNGPDRRHVLCEKGELSAILHLLQEWMERTEAVERAELDLRNMLAELTTTVSEQQAKIQEHLDESKELLSFVKDFKSSVRLTRLLLPARYGTALWTVMGGLLLVYIIELAHGNLDAVRKMLGLIGGSGK